MTKIPTWDDLPTWGDVFKEKPEDQLRREVFSVRSSWWAVGKSEKEIVEEAIRRLKEDHD